MASSLEDLNLPMSVICKIVKESLPDGVSVAKDAKSAIARAASVFVLYLTSRASENSVRNKRKTLNCEDIVAALAEIGMGDFIPQVSRTLETYKQLGYKPRATGASKRQNETLAGGSKQGEFDEEEEADGDYGDDAEPNVRDGGAPKAKRARTSPNAKRPAPRRDRNRDSSRQAEQEQERDGAESYSDAESRSESGSGSQSGSRSGSGSSSEDDADENRSASRSRSRSASGSSRS